MTKEECNKKVASGEHAFFIYDHRVWDTVGIEDMAEESFSKSLTGDLLFLMSFPLDLNLLHELS